MTLKSFLEIVEPLFDWVQLRRVLSIEKHVGFEKLYRLHDQGVLMNRSVVHQQQDLLVFVSWLAPQVTERAVDEVLKDSRVNVAFDQLVSQPFVFTDRRQ